jgi:hypothetical protein
LDNLFYCAEQKESLKMNFLLEIPLNSITHWISRCDKGYTPSDGSGGIVKGFPRFTSVADKNWWRLLLTGILSILALSIYTFLVLIFLLFIKRRPIVQR